jgi:hypothetical protein
MENIGRSIRLYLADGTPLGLITAEILNWTGHVIVAPRTRLPEVLAREEAGRTGLYLLVGEEAGRAKVYIGEGDCIADRIRKHAKDEDKEFWERVYLVTSKDANLTKAHVRYLESRLVQIVTQNGRAQLFNGNQPAARLLPEADVADMEFFINQLQLVLPTLGLDLLRPKPTILAPLQTSSPGTTQQLVQPPPQAREGDPIELFLSHKNTGVNARGVDLDGELTVLKGSVGTNRMMAHNSYFGLRQRLVDEGRLQIDGDHTHFLEDVVFDSASAAAAVLNNRNSAGPKEWRLADGTTLREWRDNLIG